LSTTSSTPAVYLTWGFKTASQGYKPIAGVPGEGRDATRVDDRGQISIGIEGHLPIAELALTIRSIVAGGCHRIRE
jgi:hypothetical protein